MAGATAPGLPPMQRDPSGKTPLNVPVGWKVQVAGDQTKSMVLVAENPASKTSPTLGMISLPQQQGVSVQTVMAQLLAAVTNPALVAQVALPGGEARIVQGIVNNVPAKLAAFVLPGPPPAQGAPPVVYGAFFVAPAARFDALGGAALLRAMVGMQVDPFAAAQAARPMPTGRPSGMGAGGVGAAPSPYPAAVGRVNVNTYQGQLAVLQSQNRSRPQTLLGKWSQGAGVTTSTYRDAVSNGLRHNSLGHGTAFIFNPDGTYLFLRRHAVSTFTCRSESKFVETGRFQYDGLQLNLQPKQQDGSVCFCSCRKPTPLRNQNLSPRSYQAVITPDGGGLVVYGTCPPKDIGCLGPDNAKYLREGFTRSR